MASKGPVREHGVIHFEDETALTIGQRDGIVVLNISSSDDYDGVSVELDAETRDAFARYFFAAEREAERQAEAATP
jgi:hypothetical protein